MKLSMLSEDEYGSLGALTRDGALVGTPLYASPEMVKAALTKTPRRPGKMGTKPKPKFKYHDAEFVKDPEMLVYAVLKYFNEPMSWTQIWKKINPELLKYTHKGYDPPTHNQVKAGLASLLERGIVHPKQVGKKLKFVLERPW